MDEKLIKLINGIQKIRQDNPYVNESNQAIVELCRAHFQPANEAGEEIKRQKGQESDEGLVDRMLDLLEKQYHYRPSEIDNLRKAAKDASRQSFAKEIVALAQSPLLAKIKELEAQVALNKKVLAYRLARIESSEAKVKELANQLDALTSEEIHTPESDYYCGPGVAAAYRELEAERDELKAQLAERGEGEEWKLLYRWMTGYPVVEELVRPQELAERLPPSSQEGYRCEVVTVHIPQLAERGGGLTTGEKMDDEKLINELVAWWKDNYLTAPVHEFIKYTVETCRAHPLEV